MKSPFFIGTKRHWLFVKTDDVTVHMDVKELDTGRKDGGYSIQRELLAWCIRQKIF